MSAVDDILKQLPISQLAQQVGGDESTTRSAAEQAVAALMHGMQANAQDPAGEASLREALSQHADTPMDLGAVDPADGDKIVSHVFGGNRDAVTQQLTSQLGGLGGGGNLLGRLMPMLAPLVLSYLAKQMSQTGQAQQAPQQQVPADQGQTAQQPAQGGGGLGDLLGSILGGGAGQTQQTQQAPAGGGLGSILGDLLGQGRRQ